MNRYDFTQPGGFPFDEGVLDFMQNCINIAAQVAALAGPLAILSGCTVAGGNVSDGFVTINGEVMPFHGGAVAPKVVVVETDEFLNYADGSAKPSKISRYATFGDDGVTNNLWANFKRNGATGVLARLDALENSSVKRLYEGTIAAGDIPAAGNTFNVAFGTPNSDTNYMVIFNVISLGGNASNDQVLTPEARNKTVNGFDVVLREPGSMTQNISIDWIVIAK